jgi:hypothetical protein
MASAGKYRRQPDKRGGSSDQTIHEGYELVLYLVSSYHDAYRVQSLNKCSCLYTTRSKEGHWANTSKLAIGQLLVHQLSAGMYGIACNNILSS